MIRQTLAECSGEAVKVRGKLGLALLVVGLMLCGSVGLAHAATEVLNVDISGLATGELVGQDGWYGDTGLVSVSGGQLTIAPGVTGAVSLDFSVAPGETLTDINFGLDMGNFDAGTFGIDISAPGFPFAAVGIQGAVGPEVLVDATQDVEHIFTDPLRGKYIVKDGTTIVTVHTSSGDLTFQMPNYAVWLAPLDPPIPAGQPWTFTIRVVDPIPLGQTGPSLTGSITAFSEVPELPIGALLPIALALSGAIMWHRRKELSRV